MKKLVLVVAMFLIANLGDIRCFSSPSDLTGLEFCSNPNAHNSKIINPFQSAQVVQHGQIKVGYSCKLPTVESRPGKNEGYKLNQLVKWTLVKQESDLQIWAAHTPRWGDIFVKSAANRTYRLLQAKEKCNEQESVVINGVDKKINMTLPEIGFGFSDANDPLNFELLKYLNFASIIPMKSQRFFWSKTKNFGPLIGQYNHSAWPYDIQKEKNSYDGNISLEYAAICVGR